MNRRLVDRIANAVLYEGYILYPYRPSIKNRQRWTFGGLYPESWCQANSGEAASNQTQCLIKGTSATRLEGAIRFLHLTARIVGEVEKGVRNRSGQTAPKEFLTVSDTFLKSAEGELPFRPVETLQIGAQMWHTWQEAEEREVPFGSRTLRELTMRPHRVPFTFAGGRRSELLRDADGRIAGILLRQQQMIGGEIEIEASEVAEGLFRLTCRVLNRTPLTGTHPIDRDAALLHALISAHTVLGVRDGEFVSLLDPPECWRALAADCHNIGVWPVLVGAEGQTDTMLSSPIILYDYPQVAPESPGDFFDATEIDEMLTLRILTMTEDEKRAMAAVDERARGLLERTASMTPGQFRGLHGTLRDFRPVSEGSGNG